MFTLEQVNNIHDEFGKSNSLVAYAEALKAVGVRSTVSFVTDGHSEFHGDDEYVVKTPAHHKEFIVTQAYNDELFRRCMKRSEKGKIDYIEMSKELAKAGVEKWTLDTEKLTFTYSDAFDRPVLIEQL